MKSLPESINYDDVADLYDIFAQVDFDIPFYLRQAGKVKGEVLELMSGTGRVSLPLVEAEAHLRSLNYFRPSSSERPSPGSISIC